MYVPIGSRTCPPGSPRCPRRCHRWAGWLTAVVIAVMASGCTPASNPVGSGQTAAATASAAASSVGSAPATSAASTPTTTTTSTPTEPPGTVIPFRTVAPESAVGRRIGLIASAGSDPFSKAVTESIVTQVKAAGAELISCDPGADATLVLDCARRFATQQVDAWITVRPADAGEALCAAGPQHVPLITIAAPPLSCETAEVGADDEWAGFLTGMELGRTSQIRDACAHDALFIVTDSTTSTVSKQRSDGIRAGVGSQCPGLLADEVLLDGGTRDRGYEAFTNALTATPGDSDILLAAVDDSVALGATAAIPDARADHITMAAVGAEQSAWCEIIANPRWIGDTALFPDRYGEVAVPALLDALQGREIPRNMYIATMFVTADSLADYYDVSDCPVR